MVGTVKQGYRPARRRRISFAYSVTALVHIRNDWALFRHEAMISLGGHDKRRRDRGRDAAGGYSELGAAGRRGGRGGDRRLHVDVRGRDIGSSPPTRVQAHPHAALRAP